MTRDELLKAFSAMSAADQEAIRAEIAGRGSSREGTAACSPGEMKARMMDMMKAMEGSQDPMACCQEMMGMCQEMLKKAGGSR